MLDNVNLMYVDCIHIVDCTNFLNLVGQFVVDLHLAFRLYHTDVWTMQICK